MKTYYGPLILVALLAGMVGCDEMQPPTEPQQPPQPDTNEPATNEPALPNGAAPQGGQPQGGLPQDGQPSADDQSSQFPGPGSYFEQPADQPPSNAEPSAAESGLPSSFNTPDAAAGANESAEIPASGGTLENQDAPSIFEDEAGDAGAPGAASDADANGATDEAFLPEIGQP